MLFPASYVIQPITVVCPDGYYNDPNATAPVCNSCAAQCLTCSNLTTCFSCRAVQTTQYYYLSTNNTCVTSCPATYFAKDAACLNCLAPCALCLNETACLSCSIGFWNGSQCVNHCSGPTYNDEPTHTCRPCAPTCLTCSKSSTYCTSCSSPLILFENNCLAACREGYYFSGGSCFQCVPPCNTCSNSTECLSCSFGYLSSGSCTNRCPDGYYPNLNVFQCTACSAVCTKCDSADHCTECVAGYCLSNGACNIIGQTNGACIATYFPLSVSNGSCFCTACMYPCLTCSSSSDCLSCVSGYLSASRCSTACPAGTFGDDSTQLCRTCSTLYPNCQICTSSNCTICQTSFYLNQFAANASLLCVSNCPFQMYADSGFCQWCISPCGNCSDQTACLSCVVGYMLKGTSCVSQCSSGEYPLALSSGIQICSLCVDPCETCTNASACLSCLRASNGGTQTYFNGSGCSVICPTTFYPDTVTLKCQKCLTPCLTCSAQSVCLSCLIGFLNSLTFKCEQCAAGSYPNTTTQLCMPCSSNCDMCLNSTSCSHCTNSTYLFNGLCITAL